MQFCFGLLRVFAVYSSLWINNIINTHCKIAVETEKLVESGKLFLFSFPTGVFYWVKIMLVYCNLFIIIDWISVMLKYSWDNTDVYQMLPFMLQHIWTNFWVLPFLHKASVFRCFDCVGRNDLINSSIETYIKSRKLPFTVLSHKTYPSFLKQFTFQYTHMYVFD